MIAAVYCRKSTDDSDKSEDARSVERQREHAIAEAACLGYEVPAHLVFIDDGVSGAEFDLDDAKTRRPGLARLRNALTPRPPFRALVIAEQSRLGRDSIRTLALLQEILDAGVQVFTYLDHRELTLADDLAEIQAFVTSWASSSERRNASARTHDALHRRAAAGWVAGGVVYGYDNVEVRDASGKENRA